MKLTSRSEPKMEFTDAQCTVVDAFLATELKENEDIMREQLECIAKLAEEALFQSEEIAEKNKLILLSETDTRAKNHLIAQLVEENIRLAHERDKLQGILERVFS